jgi:hypothetical protein
MKITNHEKQFNNLDSKIKKNLIKLKKIIKSSVYYSIRNLKGK